MIVDSIISEKVEFLILFPISVVSSFIIQKVVIGNHNSEQNKSKNLQQAVLEMLFSGFHKLGS